MKWYKKYAKCYYGNNCIKKNTTLFLTDTEPTNETINLSWDDTDKIDYLYLRETKREK